MRPARRLQRSRTLLVGETDTRAVRVPQSYPACVTATFLSPPEAGRRPAYPWQQWLDGREWTLVRGRDYWGTNADFCRRLRGAANARSLHIEVDDSDPNFFALRALPSEKASRD